MYKPPIIALPPPDEKRERRFGRVMLPAFVFMALYLPGSTVLAERGLEVRERNIANLQQRIGTVDRALKKDKQLHSKEQDNLRKAEEEISRRNRSLRKLQAEISKQRDAAKELTQQQATAEHQLQQQHQRLAAQVRASYINGRNDRLKLLLNQDDPARLGRMLGYQDHLLQARQQQIDETREQSRLLAQLRPALQKRLAELEVLGEVEQAHLDKLEAASQQRKARVAELEAKIAQGKQALQRIQAEQAALKRLVTNISHEVAKVPAHFDNSRPISRSQGKLPWPVDGNLLARYGQSKQGTSLQWNGIWIAARNGTPVRAVAKGRVVYVGRLHRYGLLVITEHAGGYYSLYGHNQESTVTVGDEPAAGEVIAYAGDSGGHRHSGLYFELRKGKTPINPLQWLSKK